MLGRICLLLGSICLVLCLIEVNGSLETTTVTTTLTTMNMNSIELQEIRNEQFAILLEQYQAATAWQCCRICPMNHLLEIDQLFGNTPPPVRRYDDPVPTRTVFMETQQQIAEAVTVTEDDDDEALAAGNCCNVCADGQRASTVSADPPESSTPPGVRKHGYHVPLAHLKFQKAVRPPLPPCCPYCKEEHLSEAYSNVVRPSKMAPLPYLQRKDKYSGRSKTILRRRNKNKKK